MTKDCFAFSQKGYVDGCLGLCQNGKFNLVGLLYQEGKISFQGRDISSFMWLHPPSKKIKIAKRSKPKVFPLILLNTISLYGCKNTYISLIQIQQGYV